MVFYVHLKTFCLLPRFSSSGKAMSFLLQLFTLCVSFTLNWKAERWKSSDWSHCNNDFHNKLTQTRAPNNWLRLKRHHNHEVTKRNVNFEPRVILATCQRYDRQIMTSGRIKFLSQESWDSGFNCACLYCLVIASGWLLHVFKIEHTVRYASGRRKERKLPLCRWT